MSAGISSSPASQPRGVDGDAPRGYGQVRPQVQRHPLGVVARAAVPGDGGGPLGVQGGQDHRRLDLGAGYGQLVIDTAQGAPLDLQRGQVPLPAAVISAPMRVSGSMTRRMGRRRMESSPVSSVVKRHEAATPESRRMVVPELPTSMTPSGWREPFVSLPPHGQGGAVQLIFHAQLPEGAQGAQGILGSQKISRPGRALGQRPEDGGAVGDGLVAGDLRLALQAAHRVHPQLAHASLTDFSRLRRKPRPLNTSRASSADSSPRT